MKSKFLLFLILLIINRANSQIHYYVSVTGNDNNNGSVSSPFQSIKKARDFLRNKTNPMTQDIIVHILGGTYILNETLEFNNADSGNNGHFIVYQGEGTGTDRTIISGGKTVTGWSQVGTNNIYQANIGNLYSRQLYINGNKAIRARSENNMGLIEISNGYFSTCNTDFSTWTNIKDLEIVSDMHWKRRFIPVENICNKYQLIIYSGFWSHFLHNDYFKVAPVKWIENAYELLDKKNEWYIRKSNSINTIFLVSDTSPTDIIIPALESLIISDSIKNIEFKNLSFNYTTWNEPSEMNVSNTTNNGFFNEQADWYNSDKKVIPAAISFDNAINVRIINNEFKHIGSTALSFGTGSSNNVICSNKFEDIAASAIRVGTLDSLKIESVSENVIRNNTITNIANEYSGSIGIFVPFAKNTTIANNTLSKFPYTGISVGWGWGGTRNVGVNYINNNRIDCTDQLIADGGGIYTLNRQGNDTQKTQVTGNYILNQRVYQGGIYLDQFSSYINISGNVIDADSRLSFPLPTQKDCVVSDIRSIVVYSGSEKVDINDNYYYYQYPKPLGKEYCLNPKRPCSDINVSNNTSFEKNNGTISSQEINDIIANSGAQPNMNCN